MLMLQLVPCYCWNLYHVIVGTRTMLLLEPVPCYVGTYAILLLELVPCYC